MFYTKRTVLEQSRRLPPDLQSDYLIRQLDRIRIDGEEILGYFEYSFLEEKTYKTQPVRADDGSIPDLENYATFLTPRLIIKYNMMQIEDYRKLMKKLKQKNVFNVECYDIVEDKRVAHEMYFAPPQMPIIYQQYLAVLGVQEYTIELIGTNRKTHINITYDFNFGSSPDASNLAKDFALYHPNDSTIRVTPNLPYNQKNVVGNLRLSNGTLLSNFTNGSELLYWSTSREGGEEYGARYTDGASYYFATDLTLYGQWT